MSPLQNPVIPNTIERAYGLRIRSVMAVGGGFSGAGVFRATGFDGIEMAIRRTHKSLVLQAERMKRLYSLIRQVSQADFGLIPVPRLPANETFRTQQTSNATDMPWLEENGIVWQVEPWMHGSSRSGHELTPKHLSEALKALNQFHQLAARAINVVGSSDWFYNVIKPSPSVQRRREIAAELMRAKLDVLHRHFSQDSDERFRRLAVRVCESLRPRLPWLHSELSALSSIAFPVQPVLRDVWRAHVLFTDDQVSGLIDLSAAASDHVLVDFTRLIRSWFGSDVSKARSAYHEFQSLRVLNTSELRLMQALDASTVLLSPVTWLRRRMDSQATQNCPDDVIARLTELTDVAETFTAISVR